jgi:predicted transcriptional regulator
VSRITDALRKARVAAKIKQGDLADALGISQAFLSDIERARRELPEQHYEKLPEPVRAAVIKAAKAELREGLRKLDLMGKGQKSG